MSSSAEPHEGEPAKVRRQTSRKASTGAAGGAASARGTKGHTYTDVAELPQDLSALVTKMLVEGAPFEDVVDAVEERGKGKLSLRAVQNHFRGDLDLQKRRIIHRRNTVRKLKEALGDDAATGQKELAEAALLFGFMGLDRKGAQFDMQDAVRTHGQRESFSLKTKKATLDEQMAETRLETERKKQELIQHKLGQLEQALRNANQGQKLGPEAFQKIKEIYGLISESTTEGEQ